MNKLLLVITAFFFYCTSGFAAEGPLPVFVSIMPQKWLVEQIGGDLIQTGVLIDKGQDPHTFEPAPSQLMELSGAALYFSVGLPFEQNLLHKLSHRAAGVRFIDTSHDIQKLSMAEHHHHDNDDAQSHHPGNNGEHQDDGHHHEEEGLDPHTWLSPVNLEVMARSMEKALIQADPANRATYAANAEKTVASLRNLHEQLSRQLAPFHGATFYVFHPAFGYFAHDYHLQQEAVEIAGKSPTPKQLSRLIEAAKADKVKTVFVQPQFDSKSAAAVAQAIGGQVVPLDPLAEDVTGNLRIMADNIQAALLH